MCGHFTLFATPLEIANRFDVTLFFFNLYEKKKQQMPLPIINHDNFILIL